MVVVGFDLDFKNFFFLAFIYEIQIAIPLYISNLMSMMMMMMVEFFFICGNKTEFFNQSINLSIIIIKKQTHSIVDS